MNKSRYLLCLFLLLGSGALIAQEDAHSSLALQWGLGHLQMQNLSFSRFIHKTASPYNIGLVYERSGKLEQQANIKFSTYQSQTGELYDYYWDTPEETQSTYASSFFFLDLNYSLGKVVLDQNDFQLTLGGRNRNRLMASNNAFGWTDFFGYYFSFGLDAWVNLQYDPSDKHHFSANLALPLVSLNTRSPYLQSDDQYLMDNYAHKPLPAVINYISHARPQSWGQSQGLDVDASYYYSLNDKWDLGGGYRFSLNMNHSTTPLTAIENLLSLNAKVKF